MGHVIEWKGREKWKLMWRGELVSPVGSIRALRWRAMKEKKQWAVKACWSVFYFLILPLARDCYRFSVPGLKYSGWKLFPSLFDAKNTSSTFSLSKSCYFCSVFVSSEKPESQSFEARLREFKSQLYHFLLSDLGQVITHSVLCFLNCKIRMIIIVPPSWASMKVKLVVEHSLRAM